MRLRSCLPLATAVLALAAAGCSSYTIKPEPIKNPPVSSEPPLPLRVGVVEKPEDFKMSWRRPMMRDADARKMTEGLRYAGLFRKVESVDSSGPAPSDHFDVLVNWSLDVKYSVGLFPFLPLCDPLIIGCFLDMTDTMSANVDVTTTDGSGKQLRQYNTNQAGTLIYQLGAIGKREVARNSTVEHAVAEIITSFIADRAYWKSLVKGRRAAPSESVVAEDAPKAEEAKSDSPKGAAEAAAGGTLVASAAAAGSTTAPASGSEAAPSASGSESAPDEAKPEPPKPKKHRALSAEEQKAIEEELLP